MKRVPVILSVFAILLSLISMYFAKSSSELVYVDVNKLVEGYKRTKIEKADFEKKAVKMKAEIDTLVSNWQKELQVYEKERTSLSTNELKLKQELLSNKQSQINSSQESIQNQIQTENKKVTQTVINDINDYVKEYGKREGYKIIFGASGSGNLMYADESTDLTSEVLMGLNAEYEKRK